MGLFEDVFTAHFNNQVYDKTYQDIDCINYKGYSESYKTWENIKNLVDWRVGHVVELGTFHGYFSFKIEQISPTTRITGLEGHPIYGKQILETTNLIKKMSSSRVNFDYWNSDSDKLVPDADIILCLNCLHHFSNPDYVLSRLNCNYIIFEINKEQIELVKKYFIILKETYSHRGGRVILLCKKEFETLCLDFTNICNYRCMFCEAYKGERILLNLKDFKGLDSIIQKAKYIDISGYGEVTNHPDFEEVVKYLTKYNKRFSLVTNGSSLDKYIELLVKSSMYLLNVSLNSLNQDTYKILTGGRGDLKKVLENIEKFYIYDNAYKKPWCRESIRQFSFVINSYNFCELNSFMEFCKKYLVDGKRTRMVFRGLSPTLVYPEGFFPKDIPEARSFLAEINKKVLLTKLEFENFSFDMSRPCNDLTQKEVRILSDEKLREIVKECTVYESNLYIGSNGNVGLCDWTKLQLGNIKDQSIDEIRSGETYKDLIKCIKEGSLKYCMNCRRIG